MVLIPNFLNSATSRVQPSLSAIGSLLADEPPGRCQLEVTFCESGHRHTGLIIDTTDVEAALGSEEG